MIPEHSNERGKQGGQNARIHETGDGDGFARWISLNRWDGRSLAGDGGLIESEENSAEEGRRLFVWIELGV